MLLVVYLTLFLNATHASPQFEEVAKGTISNLKGHKHLYKYGWTFVSSTDGALTAAAQDVRKNSEAITQFALDSKEGASEYRDDIARAIESSKKNAEVSKQTIKAVSKKISDSGTEISTRLADFGIAQFKRGWSNLITGYTRLEERTAEDRQELALLPGNYFKALKQDFSNMTSILTPFSESMKGGVEVSWKEAFTTASNEFQTELENSRNKKNSLAALPYVIWGHLKAFYYGLVQPSTKSGVKGAGALADAGLMLVAYPIAGGVALVKSSVQTVGATLYYTSKGVYKIVSPTLEQGYFALLGLASLTSSGASYLATQSSGLIGQSLAYASQPAVIGAQTTGSTVVHSAEYFVRMLYDVGKASGKVLFNSTLAGMRLGYNAITAIPTHLVLGTANVAYFLAWDGPRLVLYSIKGKNASALPPGTIVNLSKAKNDSELKVKEIEIAPNDLQKVLDQIPADTVKE